MDFAPLWQLVSDEPDRFDAQDVMDVLFPAIEKKGVSYSGRLGVRHQDYFDRYFIHSVPVNEASDASLRAAIREAGSEGGGVERLKALLDGGTPAQAEVVVRRLRSVFEDELYESVDHLGLLGGILECLELTPEQHGSLIDASARLTDWASNLVSQLHESASTQDLEAALQRCTTPNGVIATLWGARDDRRPTPGALLEVTRRYADQYLTDVIAHLREGDKAPLEQPCYFKLMFITELGDLEHAKSQIAGLLDAGVTVETLASRCVSVNHRIGPLKPKGRLSSFEWNTFAMFAPEDDVLYEEVVVDGLDLHDLSWKNRRAFVRGRALSPKAVVHGRDR